MQNGHAQPVEAPKRGVEVANKLDKDGTLVKGARSCHGPTPAATRASERRILFICFSSADRADRPRR